MTVDDTTPASSKSPRRSIMTPAVLVAACVGAGAVLRLWGIADRGLWLDETFSVLYARLNWWDVIELRRNGTNPPLYHFLLSLWVRGFGDGEAAVRMPSWVFGVVSIWGLFRLARRLTDEWTALVATALFCVSHTAVTYSQEARFYAMIELWSILTTWALHVWAVDRRRRAAVTYILLAIIFVWLHTFAWFVLAAHGAWIVRRARRSRAGSDERRRLIRGAAIGFGVVVVAFLPWVPILIDQIGKVLEGYWIERPSAWAPMVCVYDFLAPLNRIRYVAAAVAIAIALKKGLGVVFHRARGENDSRSLFSGDVPYFLLVAWLVIPVGVPFVWSLVATPIFQVKYTIVAQPAAVILFARLVMRATVPALGVLAAISLCTSCGPGSPLVVEDWREATGIIATQSQPDAPVYIYRDYCCFALTHYLPRDERVTPVYAPNQSWSDFDTYYPNPAIPFDELLHRLQHGTGQAWMVIARVREREASTRFQNLCDELNRARPVIKQWQLRQIDVLQFGEASSGATQASAVENTNANAATRPSGIDP